MAANRPSANDLGNFLDLPGTDRPSRPNVGQRPGDRQDLANLQRPNTGDRTRPGGANINTGDINIGNRVNAGDRTLNRQNNVNSIRNRWANVDQRPFDRDWWTARDNIRGDVNWHWHRNWSNYPASWCWRPCSWAACGAWFTWAATRPVRYDYGTNVVYRDNYVYINDEQFAPAADYYQQAAAIAQNIPQDVDEDQIEWMPLGVFAIAEEEAADSGMMVQLAVSHEGILAGTFYNDITGDSRPLEGTVDQKTQRAAWRFADGRNEDVVMETGVYNLTEDEATALVHHGAEKAQTWLMVRLPEPDGQDAAP